MSSDLQRWQRISAIFDEVVETPQDARSALLDRRCDGDADLRRDVEALIAADAAADSFDRGVSSARDSTAADWVESKELPSAREGERIGPWQVQREIGRGGMGVVMLADRADGQYQQRVALKLIKRGMDSDTVEARFLRERQILARLEHPHIARLLDGGVSSNGRPYFAMEYVDGLPLLQYCAEHKLGVEKRISIFIDICATVQFAHGRLIVHRDIKPSNILVTAGGEAKLLDFGIAKLLSAEMETVTQTAADRDRPLTPAYAAPEQLNGEQVSIATDVYSLGAVLYELLTSKRPFGLGDTPTRDEIRRVLESTGPLPPSQVDAADSSVPVKQLRGDLDTIVLKALKREPERRYATVDALAADLRRYLGRRPILARRDSTVYRIRKFVARHWIGVSATSLAILVLLLATGVSIYEARTAREQAKRARTVTAFLVDMFRFADPKATHGDVRMTAKEMLDAGSQQLDKELSSQPQIAAQLSHIVGTIYVELGQYDRAVDLIQHSLALRSTNIDAADHADTLADLSRAEYEKGDYAEAQKNIDAAKMLHATSNGGNSAPVAKDIALAGEIARRQGDFKQAEALTQQALAMSRVSLQTPNAQIAAELNQLATLYSDMRRIEDARVPTEQALSMFRALYGENHLDVAENVVNLGVIDMQTDKVPEALPLFEQAEAIYRKLLPGDHPLLALVLSNQARALDRLGRYQEAATKYTQALAMLRKLLGDNHPDVATTLNNFAVLRAEVGDYKSAADLCRQVIAIWQALGKPDHPMALTTRSHLADALREQGDLGESERTLREVLETARKQLGEKHPLVLLIENQLALTLRDQGHVKEALVLERQSHDSITATKGLPADLVAATTAQLALTELASGDAAAARADADAATQAFNSIKTPNAALFIDALQADARIALAQNDVTAGCALAEQAMTQARQSFGDDSVRGAQAHAVHGECLEHQQSSAAARTELSSAADRLGELLGVDSPAAKEARAAQAKLANVHK